MLQANNKSFDGKRFMDSIADNDCSLLVPDSVTHFYYPLYRGHLREKKIWTKEKSTTYLTTYQSQNSF